MCVVCVWGGGGGGMCFRERGHTRTTDIPTIFMMNVSIIAYIPFQTLNNHTNSLQFITESNFSIVPENA